MDSCKQTAILIFANSSSEELKNKDISNNERLFQYLNTNTIKKVRNTNLPFLLYSEKDQIGTTFAERFTNAIEDAFNQGYKKIITLGNDSPYLKTSNIIEASQALRTNDVVIGPSVDGGMYLIGLHRDSFDKQGFLQLPWQTTALTNTFRETIAVNSLTLHSLKYLRDIDTIQDLKYFLKNIRTLSVVFKNIVLAIFLTITKEIYFCAVLIPQAVIARPSNKGSPAKV